MKDRTNEEGIDPVTDGPTDDARRRGESESRDGGSRSAAETASPRLPAGRAKPGNHGAPQGRTMIEEILEPERPKGRASAIPKKAKPSRMDGAQRSQNLAAAWTRVKANHGAPGIDGMTVGDFPAFARGHWPRIATAIREGSYRPAPVKRAWIDSLRSPLAGHSSGVSVSLALGSEARRDETPAGDTDGAGSRDPAGSRASAGAAFRGGFQ
jgi:hypothetical protein